MASLQPKTVFKIFSRSPSFKVKVKIPQNPHKGREEASELHASLNELTLVNVNLLGQVADQGEVFDGLLVDGPDGVEDEQGGEQDAKAEYLCVCVG